MSKRKQKTPSSSDTVLQTLGLLQMLGAEKYGFLKQELKEFEQNYPDNIVELHGLLFQLAMEIEPDGFEPEDFS